MGQYTSIIEIQTNVEKALKDIVEIQGRIDKLEGKEHKVGIGVDSKKLESVINNLEKMLKSLGKGTGDFKQFETLSQELSGVSKEIQSIGKAFGNIDDSETKTLLSSIQSIDQSLAKLSQHIANVNKDFGKIGQGTSGNVQGINEALKSTEKLTEATKELNTIQQSTKSTKTNLSSNASKSSDIQNDSSLIKQNESATEQAIQSKREFAAANEGVQNSVAESKSALQLEAELMSQLAKDAREAADAKQAFVEANKQVQQSANNSNNSTKKNKYKNYTEMSEDDYMSKYGKFSSAANKFLSDSGYDILGGSVGVKFSNGFAKVSAEIKDVEGNWKRFSASVDADSKVFNTRFNPITEGINKLNSKLENFGKDVVQSETKKIFDESDLKSFESNVTSLQSKLKKSFSGNDLDKQKFINSLEDIMSKYKEYKALFEDGKIDVSNWNKLEGYFKNFQNSIDQYSTEKLNQSGKSEKYLNELGEAKTLLNELKTIIGNGNFEGAFNEDELAKIDKFINKIKELHRLGTSKEGKEGNKASFQNILGETEEFLTKNTTMSKELRMQFEALAAEMRAFDDSVPSGDKLVEFGTRLETLKTTAKGTGQTGLSFFDGVVKKARSMSQQFIAMYFSLYDFVRYVKTGFNYVKELDTAYTEMRKVSDESKSTLKNYQASTFDIANEVGTTAVQLQNSTADFMRLGRSQQKL